MPQENFPDAWEKLKGMSLRELAERAFPPVPRHMRGVPIRDPLLADHLEDFELKLKRISGQIKTDPHASQEVQQDLVRDLKWRSLDIYMRCNGDTRADQLQCAINLHRQALEALAKNSHFTTLCGDSFQHRLEEMQALRKELER